MFDDLTSPGKQTSDRAELELDLLNQADYSLNKFLTAVSKSAARRDDPITLGTVMRLWAVAVAEMSDELGFDPASVERLSRSPVPGLAFETATEVLAESRAERWGVTKTRNQLRTALDPATGSVRRSGAEGLTSHGVSWQDMIVRVARTEITALFGRQSNEAVANAGYGQKRWVARIDSRTRPTHLAANGQTVSVGQAFIVGGYAMQFPGDPSAPDSETANCRCVLVSAGEAANAGEPASLADQLRSKVVEAVGYGEYVSISTVREYLADVPRAEQDRLLAELYLAPDIVLTMDEDERRLSKQSRADAAVIGGQPKHLLKVRSPEDVAYDAQFED